jgi:hypothetical protein
MRYAWDKVDYAKQIAGLFDEKVNSYWLEIARCMIDKSENRRNIMFRLPSGTTIPYRTVRNYVKRCDRSEEGLEHMDKTIRRFLYKAFPSAGTDAPDIETLCYDLYTINTEEAI